MTEQVDRVYVYGTGTSVYGVAVDFELAVKHLMSWVTAGPVGVVSEKNPQTVVWACQFIDTTADDADAGMCWTATIADASLWIKSFLVDTKEPE